MDYDPLYDACYEAFGVAASITLSDTDGTVLENITVIDTTSAYDPRDSGEGIFFTPNVNGIRPGAAIRCSSLPEPDIDLDDAVLTMNGKNWRIESTLPKPSPNGEASGERYLYLVELV